MTLTPPGLFDDELLNSLEAAKLLRLSVSTLERMRAQGASGLPFIKLGKGKRARVVYRRGDLEAWLNRQRFTSTSEYGRNGK